MIVVLCTFETKDRKNFSWAFEETLQMDKLVWLCRYKLCRCILLFCFFAQVFNSQHWLFAKVTLSNSAEIVIEFALYIGTDLHYLKIQWDLVSDE